MSNEDFVWSYGAHSDHSELTVGVTVPGEIHLRIRTAPFARTGDGGLWPSEVEVSLSPNQAANLSEGLASTIIRRNKYMHEQDLIEIRSRLRESPNR